MEGLSVKLRMDFCNMLSNFVDIKIIVLYKLKELCKNKLITE